MPNTTNPMEPRTDPLPLVEVTTARKPPRADGYEAPDCDGFLHRNPTAQEVIDNIRPCAGDGALSLWQARSYGVTLIVIGDVHVDGELRWCVLVPFEAKGKPELTDATARDGAMDRRFRYIPVFPPPDDDTVHVWSFRPLDAETHRPVTWASLARNASRGRELRAESLAEYERYQNKQT